MEIEFTKPFEQGVKMRKLTSVLAAAALTVFAASSHAADNIAAGLSSGSYTESGSYGGQTAQELFNGGWWSSGNFGTQWVQVDLGSSLSLSSIKYTITMAPNGSIWQNVYVSDTAIGSDWSLLTPIATFADAAGHNAEVITLNLSTSGRYVEIVANGGPSWTGLVDASITAVPEPTAYLMLLAGISLLGAIARRRA
ncbi:PEP-CTERM sorting domain-containing protein [Duganella sp. FT135W]|uniref:PEP-CTERM sorting domain-containing protein n=1 Tax=Duganella flavida TaxID=2692175 RepID=A0A6L8K339_9BURK|nr:discoidin domain-containing protein [Duganella flavida]MYM21939.1 PEP-CTERM sorting domain-containing protein [Duganella flavida]